MLCNLTGGGGRLFVTIVLPGRGGGKCTENRFNVTFLSEKQKLIIKILYKLIFKQRLCQSSASILLYYF